MTFNIWLHKGTHHFIQCQDLLFPKYYDDAIDYCSNIAETNLQDDYFDYAHLPIYNEGGFGFCEDETYGDCNSVVDDCVAEVIA